MPHADHDGSRPAEPAHLSLPDSHLDAQRVTERSWRSAPRSDSTVRPVVRGVVMQIDEITNVELTWTSHRAYSLTVIGPEHGDRRIGLPLPGQTVHC
jgi:hypothetical protein